MKSFKAKLTLLLIAMLAISSTVFSQGVVGTINAMDLNFVTNNVHRMTLTTNGDLRVGISNTPNGSANVTIGGNNAINNANSNSNLLSGWSNTATNAGACVLGGMGNTASLPSGNMVSKSIALGWNNRINNHNQYLIGAASTATQEYSGAFGVSLNVTARGAYYVGGNAGANLTNGQTNSLAIGWGNRHHTGLFDVDGLTLGTSHQGGSNSTNANDLSTARLDVYAPDYTAVNGNYYPSGVRFRRLPNRFARILVIDENGYVYDSEIELEEILQGRNGGDLEKQVEELTNMVEALKAQVASMGNGSANMGNNLNPTLEIYPNPTAGNITVKHFVPKDAANGQIIFSSMTGQEIMRSVVSERGASQTNLSLPNSVANGTYLCSFYVDGKIVETKKVEHFR